MNLMGDNQLALAENIDEKHGLEQASEQYELALDQAHPTQIIYSVPTVDVKLARRVVYPGSNKVMCLAASTSVPLDESELASITDLKLRLDDGTNVVLSLNCFNDGMATPPLALASGRGTAGFITMTPSFFDPDRYKVKSDSRLSMTLLMMFAGVVLGLYLVGKLPLLPEISSNLSSIANTVNKPLVHKALSKSRATPPVIRSNAGREPIASSSAIKESKTLARATAKAPARPRPSGHVSRPLANSSGSPPATHRASLGKGSKQLQNMFVPPPPPTAFDIYGASPYPWQIPPAPALSASPAMSANPAVSASAKTPLPATKPVQNAKSNPNPIPNNKPGEKKPVGSQSPQAPAAAAVTYDDLQLERIKIPGQ